MEVRNSFRSTEITRPSLISLHPLPFVEGPEPTRSSAFGHRDHVKLGATPQSRCTAEGPHPAAPCPIRARELYSAVRATAVVAGRAGRRLAPASVRSPGRSVHEARTIPVRRIG